MNEKIPIKVLSEQVASRVNIESSDAQDAIKSIFALIADVLKEGKSVTINGLGTFSPDVNPLELRLLCLIRNWQMSLTRHSQCLSLSACPTPSAKPI